MIAAAFGAAADVPKNCPGKSPAPVTNAPSPAVRSGFCNTAPPVDEKLPGVTAVPSPRKKTRRGPSELNVSITLAVLNGFGCAKPTYAAATPNVKMLLVAACPCVWPAVATDSSPAVGVQVQKARSGAGLLHDHDARARRAVAHLLVRIVVAVLDVRRARGDDGPGGVQAEQVVVVARAAERIGPEEVDGAGPGNRQGVEVLGAGEAMKVAGAGRKRAQPLRRPSLKSPSHTPDVPSFRLPELPADEKYIAPSAATSLTAWVTTPPLVGETTAGPWPSWNGDSTK